MDTKKESELSLKKVSFYDDRWYRIERDGKIDYYVSVTTKLGIISKPFLAKWRGDLGSREADLRVFEAQQRGTRIHSAWETLTTGGLVLYQPHQKPVFTDEDVKIHMEAHNGHVEFVRYQDEMLQVWKLKRFLEALGKNYEIVASEKTVYSDKYREAGTLDNLIKIKPGSYAINGRTPVKISGGLYVCDLKTGKSVDEAAAQQTACYANACQEMGLGDIQGTLVLHTGASTRSGIEGFAAHLRTKEEMKQDFQDYRDISVVWERKNKGLQPKQFDFPSVIKL